VPEGTLVISIRLPGRLGWWSLEEIAELLLDGCQDRGEFRLPLG
jgi:hypothetical protein